MAVAIILLVLGFALYADRIDDQERCEARVRAEITEPTRDDYRKRCAVLHDNQAPS